MIISQEIKEYMIVELTKLKIKAEFEDRARRKRRYVPKAVAYQDLIDFIKNCL